ncbi:polysaccharide biosynthesis tyrosine autokinase [Weeksellaceae bacterium KMM 9724]|uniref:GumC family protein n=1 Tax=Profundicola chukchiensis TaxID=2961959 RepID=UPI00243793E1|nr:polysaccharide biosynthesis tyrosine autokinase [Profundicola chukchiensis]MDG4949863.1 polysaccharide biosynthesis tyrosine autokinase [Profundicola chukchiensis]
MNNQLQNPFLEESSHQRTAKLRRDVAAYVRRWPIFLLSILFFLFAAWLYTRYLTPIYQSTISVLVKDGKQNPGTNILLRDIALTGNLSGGISNDMQILKSMRNVSQVVRNLDLHHKYNREGRIIEKEAYGRELPILLKSYAADSLRPIQQQFQVKYKHPNVELQTTNGKIYSTQLNKPLLIDKNTFVFVKNPIGSNAKSDEFKVTVSNPTSVARGLQNRININTVEGTTIVNLSMTSINTLKSEDILQELVKVYNQESISDQNLEFEKTEEFIEERIVQINEELGGVEGTKVSFKEDNAIANLEAEASQSINMKPGLESNLMNIETQLSLVQSYKNHVQKQGIDEILPSDVSDGSNATNAAVNHYNNLVTERNNLLASGATEDYPDVKNLTANIQSSKSAILSNISKKTSSLQSMRNDISGQLGKFSAIKSSIPKLERTNREIDRQQHIKESLYLLLLQKREEAAISKAITGEKAKVLNPPSSYGPVAPVKSRYYFGAFALGLLLPLAVIYTKELLKNKIETRSDLEELVKGEPIVAELPKISMDEEFQLVGSDLSVMSEAFRIMRTNIEFVISRRLSNNKSKVILVTSSIKGEGKTFVSMNYAHVLGQLQGKRAIIIGADIRNPQLHRYDRSSKNAVGLTEYLYSDDVSLDELIKVSKSDNKTHIIFSGKIPPNPTELLMSEKFDKLIEQLRELYDYIVIDSAPLVLVSDTYHISSTADLTVYVTRSEFTPKDVIKVPMDSIEEGRLKNVVFALNDISTAHSGYAYGYKYNYGYGYGYGTVNRRRSPIKRFLSSFGINLK